MNTSQAKKLAIERFSKMEEEYYKWNIFHAECMIKAIEELTEDKTIRNKLIPLAWIHDLGKTIEDKDHAQHSIEILEKEFELDEVDRDCILNHGSGGEPKTKEGKIFRYADGLSLFYPKIISLRMWHEGKEGKRYSEAKETIKSIYEKYLEAYEDENVKDVLIRLFKSSL